MLGPLVDPLLDLVLPRRCVGCGNSGAAICGECRKPTGPLWTRLEAPSDGRGVHVVLPVVAATHYSGAARTALLAYKERGRRDLAPDLAAMLATAVGELLGHERTAARHVVLVGIPSTRRAAARRGGDHVMRLVRSVARRTGCRPASGVLAPPRGVRDSAGLTAAERSANLAGTMRAAPARSSTRRVLLVDDVVTSGATVLEAQRALLAAGWPVVGVAALAATPPEGAGAAVRWSQRVSSEPLAAHSRRV